MAGARSLLGRLLEEFVIWYGRNEGNINALGIGRATPLSVICISSHPRFCDGGNSSSRVCLVRGPFATNVQGDFSLVFGTFVCVLWCARGMRQLDCSPRRPFALTSPIGFWYYVHCASLSLQT